MSHHLRFLRIPRFWLILFILFQGTVTYAFALTLHYEMKTTAYDGALFAQLLYNVIHGHGLTATFTPPFVPQNFLGVHFSLILYALVPIYYLFPHIETLLFVHCFCIAAAAFPLFFTARKFLGSSWQSLAIASMYLVNPYVIDAQVWDFHEIAFAPLCIAGLLWAIASKNRRAFVLLSLALLTIKEHYGLTLFGAGLAWACRWPDNRRFGLLAAAAGLIVFCVIIKIAMPYFSPTGNPAMLDQHSALDRFSWISHPFSKGSPLPVITVKAVSYVIIVMLPFCYMPLFAPLWLFPAIGDGVMNMLSSFDMMRDIHSYHTAALIPVITAAFAAAVAKRNKKQGRTSSNDIIMIALILSVYIGATKSELPLLNEPNNRDINNWEFSSPRFSLPPKDRQAVGAINNLIPADASIAMQSNVLPQIPSRYGMLYFPAQADTADYIILNTALPYKRHRFVFGSPVGVLSNYFNKTTEVLADPQWGVIFYEDGWIVFQKHVANNPVLRQKAMEAIETIHSQIIQLPN